MQAASPSGRSQPHNPLMSDKQGRSAPPHAEAWSDSPTTDDMPVYMCQRVRHQVIEAPHKTHFSQPIRLTARKTSASSPCT